MDDEFFIARNRAVYFAGIPPFRSPLTHFPWLQLRALYYGFIAADHDYAMDVAARHWRFIGDVLDVGG